MNERRELAAADIMRHTGKTREQVEALFVLVGVAMGWREPSTYDQYQEAFNTFVGIPPDKMP